MITLPLKRDEQIVNDAVLAREGFSTSLILLLDGTDISSRLEFQEEGTWGQSDIPISLDFTIAGVLPRRFEDAKAELFAEVEGVLIPQMTGYVTRPMPGGDGASGGSGEPISPDDRVQSGLFSASAGALLSRVTLDAFTEYRGMSPENVVRDVFYRVPVYDKGKVRVEPLGFPVVEWTGDKGFAATEFCSDVLSRLVQNEDKGQATYAFKDTAYGGHRARVSRGLGSIGEWSRTYDARDIPDWIPPQRKTERYSEVIVYRENELATPDTPPENRYAIFERAEVNYNRPIRPAYRGTALYIPFDDKSAEAPLLARTLAVQRADMLGKGLYGNAFTLPSFDPLIESLDAYRIEDPHKDDDGWWDRAWLAEVDTYAHTFDGVGVGTNVAYTATILEEDLLRAPALIVPGGAWRIEKPLHGEAGDELYFAKELSWVEEEGEEIVFAENVIEDGEDIVILPLAPLNTGASTGVVRASYGVEGKYLYFNTDVPWVDRDGEDVVVYENDEVSLNGTELVIR